MNDVKNNKLMRVAVLCMVLAIVTMVLLLGTFAKYVTTSSYSDEARVAKWGLDASEMKTEALFKTEYKDPQDQSVTVRTDPEGDGMNVVAPGTHGEATVMVINVTGHAPETMYDFDVFTQIVDTKHPESTISSVAELDQLPGWHWTVDAGYDNARYRQTFKTHSQLENYISTHLSKKHVAPNTTPDWVKSDDSATQFKIGWFWKFENDEGGDPGAWDEQDTRLGDLAADGVLDALAVNVRINATQVLEGHTDFHVVSYDTQGGSKNPTQRVVKHLDLIPKPTFTPEWPADKTPKLYFDGWNYDAISPNPVDFTQDVVASDTIIYAHWNKAVAEYPSWIGNIRYSGDPINVDVENLWNNYDTTQLEIIEGPGDTKEATDAGTYYVTFKPRHGFCWPDGTTDGIRKEWGIDKAPVVLDQSAIYADHTADPDVEGSILYTHDPIELFNEPAMSDDASFTYRLGDGQEYYDYSKVTATDVGSYQVYWRIIPDKNHFVDGDTLIGPKKINIHSNGDASVDVMPTAKTDLHFFAVDDFAADQSLCETWGDSSYGEMMYTVTDTESPVPDKKSFTTDKSTITGDDAGTYYVWFYAYGKDGHTDSPIYNIPVTINKGDREIELVLENDYLYADIDGSAETTAATIRYNTFIGDQHSDSLGSDNEDVADAFREASSNSSGFTARRGFSATVLAKAGGTANIIFEMEDIAGNYNDASIAVPVTVDNFDYHTVEGGVAIYNYVPSTDPQEETIDLPDSIDCQQGSFDVVQIGDGTNSIFKTKGLTATKNVVIPDTVTDLNDNAFKGTSNLAKVTINSEKITEIPAGTFSGTSLVTTATTKVADIMDTTGKYVIGGNYTNPILQIPDGTLVVANSAFKGNASLKKVSLDSDENDEISTCVGEESFANCTALENFVVAAEGNKDKTNFGDNVLTGSGHSAGVDGANLVVAGGDNSEAIYDKVYNLKKWNAFTAPEEWSSGSTYYYLTGNIVHSNTGEYWHQPTIKITGGDFVIDLNNHNIDRNHPDGVCPAGLAIVMDGAAKLRLDNSASINDENNTTGQICNGYNYDGEEQYGTYTAGAIELRSNAQLDFVNGAICNNKGVEGSAIAVCFSTTINMYGGVVKGNTLFNYNAPSNEDDDPQDGFINADPRNYAGGAIDVKANATFNMYRGIVTGNYSEGHCGGVYVIGSATDGVFNLYRGTVAGNTCGADGGKGRDVYAYNVNSSAVRCTIFNDAGSLIDYLSLRGTVNKSGSGTVNHTDTIPL